MPRLRFELRQTLSARVEEALRTSGMADVTLVTDDGTQRIPAHQCVLSCSPVLRTLFLGREQRVLERPTVLLSSFRRRSVMALLSFLYTGRIELTKKSQTWQEFQELAKQLQIDPPVSKVKLDQQEKDSRKRKALSSDKDVNDKRHGKSQKDEKSAKRSKRDDRAAAEGTKEHKRAAETSTSVPGKAVSHSKSAKARVSQEAVKVPEKSKGSEKVAEEISAATKSGEKSAVEVAETATTKRGDEGAAEVARMPIGESDRWHVNDEMCEERPAGDAVTPVDVAQPAAASKEVERRPSYTPVPLDDYPSNHFEEAEEQGGPGAEASGEGGGSLADGLAGDFQMPAEFDIPVDIVKTQAEHAGRAQYGGTADDSVATEEDATAAAATAAVAATDVEGVQPNQMDSSGDRQNPQSSAGIPNQQRLEVPSTPVIPEISDSSVSSGDEAVKAADPTRQVRREKSVPSGKREDILKDLFGHDEHGGGEDDDGDAAADQDETDVSKILKGPKSRISTLTAVQNDLEAKRKRMVKRLKSEHETVDVSAIYRAEEDRRRKKRMDEAKKRMKRRKKHRDEAEEGHVCTSACPGNHRMPDEDEWLVRDDDSDDEGHWQPSAASDTSSDSDEEEADEEVAAATGKSREERLNDRYVQRSGSASRIRVSVQPFGRDHIMELREYRIKLEGSSSDEDASRPNQGKKRRKKTTTRIRRAADSSSDEGDFQPGAAAEDAASSSAEEEDAERRWKERKRTKEKVKKDREKAGRAFQRSVSSQPAAADKKGGAEQRTVHRHLSVDAGPRPAFAELLSKRDNSFKHHYGPAASSAGALDNDDKRRKIMEMSFKKRPNPPTPSGEGDGVRIKLESEIKVERVDNDGSGGAAQAPSTSSKAPKRVPFARSHSNRIVSDSE